jgi:L-fuculose-phosphate aldolase
MWMLVNLVKASEKLVKDGFVKATGGNVSVRRGNIMFISGSGRALNDLDTSELVQVDVISGKILSKKIRPSAEYLVHLKCYQQRPELRCVMLTHPPMVQSLCSNNINLKPIIPDYYVLLGKNVPHIPYITINSVKLADVVETEIKTNDCVGIVLRNYGIITVGETISEAIYRTEIMEEQAKIQYNATLLNDINFLSKQELTKLDTLKTQKYRKQLLK